MDLLRERPICSNSENGEREDSVIAETVSSANTSKYQFLCGKDFSGFIEEPETMSFIVQELYVGSNDGSVSNNPDLNTNKNFLKVNLEVVDLNHVKSEDSFENFCSEFNLEAADIDHAKAEDSAECSAGGIDLEAEDLDNSKAEDSTQCIGTLLNLEEDDGDHIKTEGSAGNVSDDEEALEELEHEVFTRDDLSERGGMVGPENDFLGYCRFSNEVSENSPYSLGSNQDLIDSGDEFIILDHVCNSVNDDTMLLGDVGEWLEHMEKAEAADKDSSLEENPSNDSSFLDHQAEIKDIEAEYLELESHLQNSNAELHSESDGGNVEDRYEQDTDQDGAYQVNSLEKSDEPSLEKSPSSSDSDDDSRWDDLWEHGNLVEQLKLELKYVRTGGLPTILEESESPKIVDDLKPLKIEEKLEHKDRMDGIQKFYKRYADKMRKLDILNYQTVNAIGESPKSPFPHSFHFSVIKHIIA